MDAKLSINDLIEFIIYTYHHNMQLFINICVISILIFCSVFILYGVVTKRMKQKMNPDAGMQINTYDQSFTLRNLGTVQNIRSLSYVQVSKIVDDFCILVVKKEYETQCKPVFTKNQEYRQN